MWLLGALLALDVAYAQPAEPSAPTEADLERARVLFANGKRLYDEGSYEAAIEAWQACYDISQRDALLYNLSNAYERLGNFSEALAYLNRYRAVAELPPEEHDRLARKASTLEVRVRSESAVVETDAPVLTPPPEKSRSGRGAAGTALTVVGGAAAITGAVLGGLALNARGNVDSACMDVDGRRLCPASADADIRQAEQLGTLSLVALGVGGAGLVSGITVLVSGGDDAGASVEVSMRF
ncbi:MAG: tetratricopeptide repeat protein [Myxococcota bacterium]